MNDDGFNWQFEDFTLYSFRNSSLTKSVVIAFCDDVTDEKCISQKFRDLGQVIAGFNGFLLSYIHLFI